MIGDFSSMQNLVRQRIGTIGDVINNMDVRDGTLRAILNYDILEMTNLYRYLADVTTVTTLSTSTLSENLLFYKNLTIGASQTITTDTYGAVIVADTITFGNSSTLTASGKGTSGGSSLTVYSAGTPAGSGTNAPLSIAGTGGGGAGMGNVNAIPGGDGGDNLIKSGGAGATNDNGGAGKAAGKITLSEYATDYLNRYIGTGGGGGGYNSGTASAGGAGGGCIVLVARQINYGTSVTLSASGVSSSASGATGGGGGGGSVIVLAHETNGSATITVSGATAGTGSSKTGGTGGAGQTRIVGW